jgi:predicted small secreted protein
MMRPRVLVVVATFLAPCDNGTARAVGIEVKATLKARKLLILLNEKNAKNT